MTMVFKLGLRGDFEDQAEYEKVLLRCAAASLVCVDGEGASEIVFTAYGGRVKRHPPDPPTGPGGEDLEEQISQSLLWLKATPAFVSFSHDQMDKLYETYPLYFPDLETGGKMKAGTGPFKGLPYAPLTSLAGQVEALAEAEGGAWAELHELLEAAHACGVAVRLH